MHEHFDESGFIHMNGRTYDPRLGRMMQADPFVQVPTNLQNYNRYSYVLNAPLAYTDPSGFNFWGDLRQSFSHQNFFDAHAQFNRGFSQGNLGQMMLGFSHVNPGMAAVDKYLRENPNASQIAQVAGAAGCAVIAVAFTPAGGAGCMAAMTAMYQANIGASNGNIIRHSHVAFVQTYALHGIGDTISAGLKSGAMTGQSAYLFKIASHAVVGCMGSAATGGECESGAISAAFGAATSPQLPGAGSAAGGVDWGQAGANLVLTGVMGGIGAELSGGNFRDGFKTAAWGYLFNELLHVGELREAMKRAAYVETAYPDGTYCNIQGVGSCGFPGSVGQSANSQGSATIGGTAMMGPVGISFEEGKAVDSTGQICWVSSKCALTGLGLGVSADLNTQVSGGNVSNGWQLSAFGKGVPLMGGELTLGYGSDGLSGGYGRSFGSFFGVGLKICGQKVMCPQSQ